MRPRFAGGAVDLRPEEIVRLEDDRVVLLDQRRLPDEEVELECRSAAEVAEAIRTLAVRGAPAIGVAAAYGYALAAANGEDLDEPRRTSWSRRGRPRSTCRGRSPRCGSADGDLAERARDIHRARGRALPAHGRACGRRFSREGSTPLTHCNAGALATGGYGSALGAVKAGFERGLVEHVFVDETRPLLQGARLTAWELERAGDPASVIADSAAGVAHGARRGHARDHRRRPDRARTATRRTRSARTLSPCSPPITRFRSTSSRRPRPLDLGAASGADIPIEERDPAEVSERFAARNPAFDVTPAALIDGDRHRGGRPSAPSPTEDVAGAVKAMVMAAGLGTRLRPLTDFLPKPMMPVANRPVLHHLLNLLRRHDVREVGINVHAFPEMIEKLLRRRLLARHVDPLVARAGAARHRGRDEEAAGLLGRRDDPRHLGRRPPRRRRDRAPRPSPAHGRARHADREAGDRPDRSYGVVILDRDTRVRGFQEKPTRDEARSDLANCGVYVIEPELLERIPADTFVRLRQGHLAEPRRGRRGDLRLHDDGLLERRRRPRRAPQHDSRRGARARAHRHPGRGDRAGRLGGGGLPDRRLGSSSTARSSSAPTSSSRRTRRSAARPRSARSASSARARPSAAPHSSRGPRCRTRASRSRGSSATRRSSPTRCCGIPRANSPRRHGCARG